MINPIVAGASAVRHATCPHPPRYGQPNPAASAVFTLFALVLLHPDSVTETGGSLPFCPLAFYILALGWHIYEESRKGCHAVNTDGKFRVLWLFTHVLEFPSLLCTLEKAKNIKASKKKSIFFLLLFYRWCHPVGPLVKTTVALSLSAVLYCCATTFSPLGSILSPAQQRQVANFLPFNLQQFPCSRRSQTQEEEPRLPWVNWGRGLAKRQWREVKVF